MPNHGDNAATHQLAEIPHENDPHKFVSSVWLESLQRKLFLHVAHFPNYLLIIKKLVSADFCNIFLSNCLHMFCLCINPLEQNIRKSKEFFFFKT